MGKFSKIIKPPQLFYYCHQVCQILVNNISIVSLYGNLLNIAGKHFTGGKGGKLKKSSNSVMVRIKLKENSPGRQIKIVKLNKSLKNVAKGKEGARGVILSVTTNILEWHLK